MEETLTIRGDFIKLDQALKAVLALSGGEAKDLIVNGAVLVNGEVELRRGRKLHGGDVVEAENTKIFLQS